MSHSRESVLGKALAHWSKFHRVTTRSYVYVYVDANRLQFINVDTEIPSDVQDEDDEPREKISIPTYCTLYGTASVRAMTETLFTGSLIVDTKIIGKLRKQYLIRGGVYEVNNGSLFVTI